MKRFRYLNWIILSLCTVLFIVIIINPGWWEVVLRFLFPQTSTVVYARLSLMQMLIEHMKIVIISSSLTIIVGIPLGIVLTSPSMKDFLAIINNLISIGQTFPPVAVLALTVPLFGFGIIPTIIALFLYGLLPIVRNTIAGIQSVPSHVLDAAYGIGMSNTQVLLKIKLPLSARIILAGVRISVIINIGTAMIGAVIGAGGLGVPVIAGLVQDNLAFVLQGVIPAVFLTVLVDQMFNNMEKNFVYVQENQ